MVSILLIASAKSAMHVGKKYHVRNVTNAKRDKDYFPLRVARVKQPGLAQDIDLLIDQIRAISNRRFMGSQPLAQLSTKHLKRVEEALKLPPGR